MKKRITALMLALLMLALAVSSCGAAEDDLSSGDAATDITTTATELTTTEATTDNNLDVNGYWKDDLPEDLNLNGEKVTILYDNSRYAQEFIAEEITGDLINDAIDRQIETGN